VTSTTTPIVLLATRATVATVATVVLLAAPLAAQPAARRLPDVPAPDTLGANFRHDSVGTAGPNDFDLLEGRWEIRFQTRRSATEFNPPVAGTWTGRRSHDGLVLEDDFSLVNAGDGSRSLTVTYRVYNRERKTWEIVGTSAKNGNPWAPGTSWSGGGDRFVVQTYGTGPDAFITRIRYYDITADHFLWRADASSDGGKTWTRDFWKIEARRVRAGGP
jgi:hypothetical protein